MLPHSLAPGTRGSRCSGRRTVAAFAPPAPARPVARGLRPARRTRRLRAGHRRAPRQFVAAAGRLARQLLRGGRANRPLRPLAPAHLHPPPPRAASARLQQSIADDPHPDRVFALAEISYHLGRAAERCADCEAVAYYYTCAGYAYHYLFQDPTLRGK